MITEKFIAGQAMSKYTIVRTNNQGRIVPAFWPESVDNIVGMLPIDVVDGQIVDICLTGVLDMPGFVYTPGDKLYITYGGYITFERPQKSIVQVGHVLTADKIFIKIRDRVN